MLSHSCTLLYKTSLWGAFLGNYYYLWVWKAVSLDFVFVAPLVVTMEDLLCCIKLPFFECLTFTMLDAL